MIGDMRAPSTDARSRWRMSLLTPRGPRSAARSASRAAYTGSGWVIVVLLLDFSGSLDFSGGTAAAARLARAASPAVLCTHGRHGARPGQIGRAHVCTPV